MREVQLPCAPLGEWLPARLGDRVRVSDRRRGTPWAIQRFAARWEPLPEPLPPELRLDGLLILDDLAHPPAPGLDLDRLIGPGGWVAEIVPVRAGLLATVFGIDGARRSARRAAMRSLGWGLHGLADVEQWASVDPPDCVVTLGRLRPGACKVVEEPRDPLEPGAG